ncbi:MAG: hypothetical protein ACR2LE_05520 [Nocardioidaceae bacterium]
MAIQVARAISERGELVLLRRDDDELELRVNGMFVMDSAETTSERLLASTALAHLRTLAAVGELGRVRRGRPEGRPRRHILIGGLGLGFTLEQVLSDRSVAAVTVAEIEPALVGWHRAGLVPATFAAISDSRVSIVVEDVRTVVENFPPASLDLLLLDVDNGPGQLVHDANVSLYADRSLRLCRTRLSSSGVLAVWSSESAPALHSALQRVFGDVEHLESPVTLGRRQTTYHLYLGRDGPTLDPCREL